MSVENAKAFIEKLNSDADLRAKIEGAADDNAKRAAAKEAGFDFTRDDMKAAAGSHSSKGGELSEEQLSAVAGGDTAGWALSGVAAGASVVGAAAAAA